MMESNKKCFTPIQTVTIPSSDCMLCPSMDIMAIMSSNRLVLQRTVSWQRLASFDYDDIQAISWSPDGSLVALSILNEGFVLYDLERGMSNNTSSCDAEDCLVHTQKFNLPDNGTFRIDTLFWSQVGRPHAAWTLTNEEKDRSEEWKYRCDYLDRSSLFLPPSSYDYNGGSKDERKGSKNCRPGAKAPLSLLCAVTNTGELQLLIHGRYPIATLPHKNALRPTIICSSDLIHISILKQSNPASNPSSLDIYSIPAFDIHRYSLQTISALYSSIKCHLKAMQEGVPAVTSAWKNALRPLDMKMEGLSKILTNYGIPALNLGSVLNSHIILGRTWEHANALEQFWTGVQMNDQLLVRMQKSLHNALAGVETMARSNLLAPVRSLVISVQQLHGLDSELLPETLRLCRCTKILLFTTEYLVFQIVQNRLRIRDFVSWLRCASSAVKAQDTPPDSVQSENARKRRVPQSLVHRVADYFQQEDNIIFELGTSTEKIIGSRVSATLSEKCDFVQRSSDQLNPLNSLQTSLQDARGVPTLPSALSQAEATSVETFQQPRAYVRNTISQKEILLPLSVESCAIHSRIGVETLALESESILEGAFRPLTTSSDESFACSRQWTILAFPVHSDSDRQGIQLILFPLGIKKRDFVLSRCLSIPSQCTILDIGFYGDDGKSSLAAGKDTGTGKEGRQAMALIIKQDSQQSLWLINYDSVRFDVVPFSSSGEKIDLSKIVFNFTSSISIVPVKCGEDGEDSSVVNARTRVIDSVSEDESKFRLLLCGSRGVGGVLSSNAQNRSNFLALYDLEEDEDEEDTDDEEMVTI